MVLSHDLGGSKPAARIRIQDRDLAVLTEIGTAPAITIEHLTDLFFRGRRPAAYRRIGMLRRAGLIRLTRPFGLSGPALIALTKAGTGAVADRGAVSPENSDRPRRGKRRVATIAHDLAIQDVRVAFVRGWGLSRNRFTTEVLPAVDRRWMSRVRPDGYIAVRSGAKVHHFLLEVDRSTETHATIRHKIAAYRELRRRSGFRGGEPFRVLFVCRSAARRDNLAALALSLTPPVLSQCWFATLDDVKADLRGAIWLTPYALRAARRTESLSPTLQPLIED